MSISTSNISKALESLVHKRQQQLAYLRRTHQPDVDTKDLRYFGQQTFWLNTICVDPKTINEGMSSEERKIRGWFCLGHSLSKLLDIDSGTVMVNSFVELMEEFSYQFGGKMHASFSYLRSKNIAEKFDVNSNQPIKPIIWKQSNKVVFQFLETPRLPKGLNYCLVVYSMLSILYLLYSKFLHQSCSNEIWRKAIENLDEKISVGILKELTDVLTKLTNKSVNNEINDVMPGNDSNSVNEGSYKM